MQPTGTGAPIAVDEWGAGPRVVLVHGATTAGAQSWDQQRPLAERWTLVVPDRRGYGSSPNTDRSDFEVDAVDVDALLGDGAHLVGHSYGAIVALFAAARRPTAVRSLTVIEPPAHCLRRGEPGVEAEIAAFHHRHDTISDPQAFQRAFLTHLGMPVERLPETLTPEVERNVRVLMNERPPWDAPIPTEVLRAAGVPTLIVTGGHHPVFEGAAEALAAALAPHAERAVIPGRGHTVQRVGAPFNTTLEAFLNRH